MRFRARSAGEAYSIALKLDEHDFLDPARLCINPQNGNYVAFSYLCAFSDGDGQNLLRVACLPDALISHDALSTWNDSQKEQLFTSGATMKTIGSNTLEILLSKWALDEMVLSGKYIAKLGNTTLRVESAGYHSHTSEWHVAA